MMQKYEFSKCNICQVLENWVTYGVQSCCQGDMKYFYLGSPHGQSQLVHMESTAVRLTVQGL